MSKEHDIARRVCDDAINSGKKIYWDKLCKNILRGGGILRVVPGTTIGEYMQDYVDAGILRYVPKGNYFELVSA